MNLTLDHFEETQSNVKILMGEIQSDELYHRITNDIFQKGCLYVVDVQDQLVYLHLIDMRLTRLPDGDYEIRFWVDSTFDPRLIQIDSPIYAPYEVDEMEYEEEEHADHSFIKCVEI